MSDTAGHVPANPTCGMRGGSAGHCPINETCTRANASIQLNHRMTNGPTSKQKRHFTLAWLPWLLLGTLVLALSPSLPTPPCPLFTIRTSFFATNALNLSYSGDSYSPQFLAPVYVMPGRSACASIPVAMNFFAVVCGNAGGGPTRPLPWRCCRMTARAINANAKAAAKPS